MIDVIVKLNMFCIHYWNEAYVTGYFISVLEDLLLPILRLFGLATASYFQEIGWPIPLQVATIIDR